MKKISLVFLLAMSVGLPGCLKDNPAVDFSQVGTIIEISPPFGGEEYFDESALVFEPGTTRFDQPFVVNVSSPKPLPTDLQIKMAITDTSRLAYNAAHQTAYDAMPDSDYAFAQTTGTIPAGGRLDTFHLVFNADKIDTTKSYMLPVSIGDAQGQPISGNFHTIYFHTDAR